MIVVSVVISVIWIVLASRQGDAPLAPTTIVGRVALASLSLMIAVVIANASWAATLPAGVVMLALGSFARWVRHDRGLLLVLPVVFGLTVLVLPIFFE